MKKLVVVFMVIATLFFTACSQANQQTGSSASPQEGTSAPPQEASNFPEKPIELMVPFPPGGGTDLIARTIAKHAQKYMPNEQEIIVINSAQPGVAGVTEIMKADADGYRIGMIPMSYFTNSVHVRPLPFSKEDFEPIVKVATARQTILVQEDAPWATFEDWLVYVKEHPGEFSYGTVSTGGLPHIAMELLNKEANIETKHVPFDAVGPLKTALIGGHVDGIIAPITGADRGSLRPLVSFSREKGELTQDVPLLKEKGIDNPALEVVHGIYAPKGISMEKVTIIHEAIKKTLEDPGFLEDFKKTELDVTYASGEQLLLDIEAEYELFSNVLKDLGFIE